MYAPRVFTSMLGALLAFAVAAYFMSGSLLTAFLQTIVCAIIIQIGYFLGVLYLARQEKQSMGVGSGAEAGMERRKRDMLVQDDLHTGATRNMPAGDS
jgi:membrane protein implicated in regulation of membrane protease activity